MKTKLLILALALFTSNGILQAQKSSQTVEEKASALTSKMNTFYGLSSLQTSKVEEINLKFIRNGETIRKSYAKSIKLEAKKKELQSKYDEDILAVLDVNQQVKHKQECIKRDAKREANRSK